MLCIFILLFLNQQLAILIFMAPEPFFWISKNYEMQNYKNPFLKRKKKTVPSLISTIKTLNLPFVVQWKCESLPNSRFSRHFWLLILKTVTLDQSILLFLKCKIKQCSTYRRKRSHKLIKSIFISQCSCFFLPLLYFLNILRRTILLIYRMINV